MLDLERQVLATETLRIEQAIGQMQLEAVEERPVRVAAWRTNV